MLCLGILFLLFAVDCIYCQDAQLPYVSPYAPADCKQTQPTGTPWNNEASVGVWYQYMYAPPNNPFASVLTNPVEVYRPIGWVYDTKETIYIQSYHVTGRLTAEPHTCWAAYGIQNTTCNGFVYANGYGLGTNGTGEPRSFVKLYLDPSFLYVRVECITDPLDAPHEPVCDYPGVAVWTRKMAKDITPLEDLLIRDILDDRMQLYCLTNKDFRYAQWLDLPPCEYGDKPLSLLKSMKDAQENWVSKCHSPGTGACAPASIY